MRSVFLLRFLNFISVEFSARYGWLIVSDWCVEFSARYGWLIVSDWCVPL
jgi:hypothetical protein